MLKKKTHLPVIIDPSHAAGIRFMVEPLAMAAIAAGADGLMIEVHNNISTPVSEPRPGDLVFFVGTYDTPGVSHVGFYVGDGMLLHCGDPIQYTSLNSNYWQSHLYAYGRPPYN